MSCHFLITEVVWAEKLYENSNFFHHSLATLGAARCRLFIPVFNVFAGFRTVNTQHNS